MPGLVNAHTHLELSWMAGRVPPKPSMDEWIRELMAVRSAGPTEAADASENENRGRELFQNTSRPLFSALAAAVGMVETGTVLVGDVSNTLMTPGLIASAGLRGVVFHELVGFSAPDPAALVEAAWARCDEVATLPLEFSVVAHAPYSTSHALIQTIAAARRTAPLAIHLGESDAELEFVATGQGPMRRMLERLGVWNELWPVPGCDPVEYIDRLGYLQAETLIVHATRLGAPALGAIRKAGAVIVSCPRSNRWVGSGSPPLAAFYQAGIPVAFGTDSLASVESLNVFDELAAARRIAPAVSASTLLESATRVGAQALGFGADYGTIEPGKLAALIAVSVPAAVADVEEYLVGGDVRAPQDVRLIRSR
jgi:cytosine/adenosine deaminase-related metal-dependent hydrolase